MYTFHTKCVLIFQEGGETRKVLEIKDYGIDFNAEVFRAFA